MEEVLQIITSLFECLKKGIDDTISDIKDLREEIKVFISDLQDDISTSNKKFDSLNVEIDNTSLYHYEHGDGVVIKSKYMIHTAMKRASFIIFVILH